MKENAYRFFWFIENTLIAFILMPFVIHGFYYKRKPTDSELKILQITSCIYWCMIASFLISAIVRIFLYLIS